MFRGFSPGLEISKLKNSQRYFLARSDEGVNYINDTNKDNHDLGNDAAAGDDANLRFGLLMPVAPVEQVFLAKRVLAKAVPVTKIYLPNVTTTMTTIMALVCPKK